MSGSILFLTSRETRTAFSKRQHNINKSRGHQTLQYTGGLTDRPYTTSLERTHPAYSYQNFDEAEQNLKNTFKGELSSYVKRKFMNLASKHQQSIITQRSLRESMHMTTANPQQAKKMQKNKPRTLQLMKICGLGLNSPTKVQKVLGEPYLINTKQKLSRILSRKKQMELQFQILQAKVQESQNEKLRMQKQKNKKFRSPEHVINIQWDSEWRKGNEKSVKRYRTRLQTKHHRQTSPLTIEW